MTSHVEIKTPEVFPELLLGKRLVIGKHTLDVAFQESSLRKEGDIPKRDAR